MTDITGEALFLGSMIFLVLPISSSLPKRLAIVGACLGILALGLAGAFRIYSPAPVGDWLLLAGALLGFIGGVIVAGGAKNGALIGSFSKASGHAS